MSFFNSKEEILNIELTQMGKYLISKGKFNPKYYAFFDDDILYDSSYGNIQENQNEIQKRILDETPYTKPQGIFSGVSERSSELNETVVKDDIKVHNSLEKQENILPYSLGTSDYNSEYFPAWKIDVLSGEIFDYSINFIDSGNSKYTYSFLKIPQINLKDGEFRLHSSLKAERSFEENSNIFFEMPEESSFDVMSFEYNLLNVIQVVEANTQDNNKNFDIEVFIEEGGEWKPLKFFKEITNINNNILLDEYINLEVSSQTVDENCVEYYFEMFMDDLVAVPDNVKQSMATIYSSPISDQFKPFGEDC